MAKTRLHSPFARTTVIRRNNDLMLSVVAAFLAFFGMLVLWPTLVWKNTQSTQLLPSAIFWDSMLSVKKPKQIIRVDETVYDLTAEHLHVMTENSNQVLLTHPHMMATQTDGTWMTVTAQAGLYNKQSRVLQLIADVRIQDAQGSDLFTDSAVVRLSERKAMGYSRIYGTMGEKIDIDAQGFRLMNTNPHYEFMGSTQMVIRAQEDIS